MNLTLTTKESQSLQCVMSVINSMGEQLLSGNQKMSILGFFQYYVFIHQEPEARWFYTCLLFSFPFHVYMYLSFYMNVHMCDHSSVQVHLYVYICVCACMNAYVCEHAYIQLHVCVCSCSRTCVCMRVSVFFTCTCVYMFILAISVYTRQK